MISFQSDYNNGMLPEILEALGRTNDDKTPGYGYDHYTESAKQKIRKAIDNEEADVFFLVEGTQTNQRSSTLYCWVVRESFVWRLDILRCMSLALWRRSDIRLSLFPPSTASLLLEHCLLIWTDSWLTRRIPTWCNQEWYIYQCLLSLEWYIQRLSLRICTPHAGNMICVCLSTEHDWAMD